MFANIITCNVSNEKKNSLRLAALLKRNTNTVDCTL